MTLSIETNMLGKNYGSVRAVEGLSLRIEEGEIYSFLGLNGAGKTTTIRMLLGMIRPSGGEVKVLGVPVRVGKSEPWAAVGYLVETPHSYPELTVLENLEVARRLHPGTPKQAVKEVVERLGLEEYAERRAGVLSQGNAQRLGLAKALLHRPRLLILDEPANALDPAGIVEVRQLLLELAQKEGVTVFMSSHILAEVARVAMRIGIIHQGRYLQELNRNNLEQNRHKRLIVRARHPQQAQQSLMQVNVPAELLSNQDLLLESNFAVHHPDEVASILVQAGNAPTYLAVEEEDLEAYFLRLVGEGAKTHD